MNHRDQCHKDVLDAFQRIDLNGMLSWAVLDQKPEKYITVALAAALNGERRRAVTEHMRRDLVLIDKWAPDGNYRLMAGYEAKCEHLARFSGSGSGRVHRKAKPRRDGKPSATADWYNGGCLAAELALARRNTKKWKDCPVRGGLFYLVEMSPPTEHSNFRPRHPGESLTVEAAIRRIEDCVKLEKVDHARSPAATVSIGKDQNVNVQLHLVLFDASPDLGLSH